MVLYKGNPRKISKKIFENEKQNIANCEIRAANRHYICIMMSQDLMPARNTNLCSHRPGK